MIRHTLLFSLILPFGFPQFSRGQAVGPLVPRMAVRCETSALSAQPLALIAGETINLEVRFTAYNAPLDIVGASVMLHARTNGMDEGFSWQLPGIARDGGLAVVRIDTSAWLPPSFKKGEWRLEVIQTNSASLLRAGGQISVMGTGIGSASAPVPSSVLHELWEAIEHLQTSTNAWDAAYSWGNHTGLYLDLPAWQTWLSTNTLATTSYVDQALSSIPTPQADRIINERQMLDADLDIWDVRDVGDTNVLILARGYNYAPGAPPVPIDTRYTLGSMVVGGITVPAYISSDPDYHAIYRQGADWYFDLPGAGAHKLTPRAPGYGEVFQWQYGGYELYNGVIPAFLMFDRPRRPPLMVDRLALASELDGGDYVPRQGGTATNLTLAGWVSMPQSQPTNLVLRLVASNEFILVKEVLQ